MCGPVWLLISSPKSFDHSRSKEFGSLAFGVFRKRCKPEQIHSARVNSRELNASGKAALFRKMNLKLVPASFAKAGRAGGSTGHDFSRAVIGPRSSRALAPSGRLSGSARYLVEDRACLGKIDLRRSEMPHKARTECDRSVDGSPGTPGILASRSILRPRHGLVFHRGMEARLLPLEEPD